MNEDHLTNLRAAGSIEEAALELGAVVARSLRSRKPPSKETLLAWVEAAGAADPFPAFPLPLERANIVREMLERGHHSKWVPKCQPQGHAIRWLFRGAARRSIAQLSTSPGGSRQVLSRTLAQLLVKEAEISALEAISYLEAGGKDVLRVSRSALEIDELDAQLGITREEYQGLPMA